MENYALVFPSIQLVICYHGKLIVNQSHLLAFLENRRTFNNGQKIPLSTSEAGFIALDHSQSLFKG